MGGTWVVFWLIRHAWMVFWFFRHAWMVFWLVKCAWAVVVTVTSPVNVGDR